MPPTYFCTDFAVTGGSSNPDAGESRAVALSALIAFGAVALGNLNFLAPIITMFFLAAYALLNYTTYFVADAASPYFRPRFKPFNKHLSLLGALACIGAALAVNWIASLIAVSVIFGIYQYLRQTAQQSLWSDSKRVYGFQRIREFLLDVDALKAFPRDWRSQILALSKDKQRRRQLLCFAAWIEGKSGLTSLVSILERDKGDRRDRQEVMKELKKEIEDAGVDAFPLVVEAPDFRTAIDITLQAYGIGPIKANTILLNWLEEQPRPRLEESGKVQERNLKSALHHGLEILLNWLEGRPSLEESEKLYGRNLRTCFKNPGKAKFYMKSNPFRLVPSLDFSGIPRSERFAWITSNRGIRGF